MRHISTCELKIITKNYKGLKMRKLILTTIALFIFGAVATAQMPKVSVENSKGEMINTADLVDGKTPMIVSFWSTTCKPCILELNAINDALDEWLEVADFRVVAVSIDDSRSSTKAKSMATGNGWDDFIVLLDKNQDLKRAMNVNLTPQVFVLDGEGKIVYSHTGYTPGSENELIEKIKEL